MTTIAAKNYGYKIVLGADSQVTTNEHYVQIQQEKILRFKIKENYFYLCCSGQSNTITWLKHFLHTADLEHVALNDAVFTQIQLILIKFFKFIKENLKDSGVEIDTDFYAIIVFKGRLIYYSAGNYEEIPPGKHIAFGTGSHFALGAMDAGAEVKEAIQIACQRDVYSGGEIDVINFDMFGSTHNMSSQEKLGK